MKKNIIILSAMLFSSFALSQVGVNTPDPKATLDITAKISKGKTSNPEGLLVPRVDRERAQSMIGTAISTLVYVDDATTGLQNGTAINIDETGYYYFDGRFWVKLNTPSSVNPLVNIYNSDGTLSANRTVNQSDKTLSFTGSTVNSFSIDRNTFSVDAENHRVGMGTTTPHNMLDLGSNAPVDITDDNGKKLAVYNNAGGTSFYGLGVSSNTLQIHAASAKGAAPAAVIAGNTGNFGIGDTAPAQRLSIVDRVNTNQYQGIASFLANNLTQGVGIGWGGIQSIGTADNVNLNLNGKGTGNVLLQTASTGNVGIGTASPVYKLDFGSTAPASASDPSAKKLALYSGTNGNTFYGLGVSSYRLLFHANDAQTSNPSMVIDGLNKNVGIGTNDPNGRAILDLSATNKGFLPPRLTTAQRNALSDRPAGLMIYNVNTNCMDFWNSSAWVSTCAVTAPPAGAVTTINCAGATNNGTIVTGSNNSVSSSIPYTGGNGGSHGGQVVASTGVTGLTATLTAGSFANGNGTLTYNITGTPSAVGTASFAINIGGQTCTLSRAVTLPVGAIASLNCAGATNNGTLTGGTAASGVSSVISYTGGNAGTHSGQTGVSTGVTGLTATLTAGTFANGNGTLTYTITGTPSGGGTASFAINIGGRTCTLSRTVTTPVGAVASLNCAGATNNGTLTGGTAASGVSSVISYTGGNTGTHNGQTVASTGVTGLTATLTSGAFANGNGTLTYTITGTPNVSGTASFAINIGGRTCTLTRTVAGAATPPATPSEACTTNSFAIPYAANGTVLSGNINGVPVTATITHSSVTSADMFCLTYYPQSYRVKSASNSVLKIKFSRPVSNFTVRSMALVTGYSILTFKNNGTTVNPTYNGLTTISCGAGAPYYIANWSYGGAWFDEVEVKLNGGEGLYSFCVNSIQ